MTDQTPMFPDVEEPGRSLWRNLSFVWLVPVLALVVALAVAWQAYSERGGLIEISFENGAGVSEGETTIRYRDVVVGEVESVHFSEDLGSVIVAARIENDILPFLDEDASFWVVRPEISAQGVSGLSTVVSGVYIEGTWDNEIGAERHEFTGLERALFVRPGEEGRRITLNVDPTMQLTGGAPILYRGLEVGRIEAPRLVDAGQKILVDAFIEAPYDQHITAATRFWDTSGFSINFGTEGLSLDVESLASLVGGGLSFDEVYRDGDPVAQDYVFNIFASEETARGSAFDLPVSGAVPVSIHFPEFTRSLRVGLNVQMDGERIGEITAVSVRSYQGEEGLERRHVATLLLDPQPMGLPEGTDREAVYDFLAQQVAEGMRARISSGGLLSTESRVEFARDDYADNGEFVRDAEPFPQIPTIVVARSNVNATAEGVLERVAALPFEDLLNQAIDTMASFEELAGDEGLRQVPLEAVALINDARDLIATDDIQGIPGTAAAAVEDLRAMVADARALVTSEDTQGIPGNAAAAAADLSALVTELRESGSIDTLTSVLSQADATMGTITEASAQLPDIMANVTTLSESAAALEIETLIARASAVLASADTFLSNEDLDGVPADVSAALNELESLLQGLQEADVVGSLNATLASTQAAADELPGLVTQTEAVLAQIGTLSSAYGTRSDFMVEAMDVLREITVAARSIAQLARTIERNPNSLLTGR